MGVPDAGQTDLVTGSIPYKFRERPLAVVPLVSLYRKTRAEGTISSVGVKTHVFMNDLVVG